MGKLDDLVSESLLIIFLFVAISIITNYTQHQISYNDGKGWDGVQYYTLAEQMIHHESLKAQGPYVYRIGTPYLASLIPFGNISLRFTITNIIACVILTALLVYWFRIYIPNWKIRVIMLLLFMTQWHAPIRFTYFYPILTDPWALVFTMAGLILIHKGTNNESKSYTYWVAALSFVGVFFREVLMLIPITWWYAKNYTCISQIIHSIICRLWTGETTEITANCKNITMLKACFKESIPLLAGMIAVISIRTVAHQTNHYRFAETAVAWMYDKPLLTYLHAWFIAFGPMIVLPLLNCNLITTFFRTHRFHLIFLVMISILGWIGGSDTERIIYYAMPIVYVQIANVLLDTMEVLKHSPILITFIILIQCVSQRIFWYLPDYPPSPHGPIHSLPAIFGNTVQFYHIPFLTILSSCGNYLDLFSFHSGLTIKALTLVQYIIVSVMLLVWMRIRDISLGHRGFVR